MKKILSIIILGISIISCQSGDRVFSENQDLSPNVEWLKKDVKTFEVPIENIDVPYNLSLAFRYTEGIQYRVVKVKVTEISPSKRENMKEYELKVIDENGDYVGEPGLSIFDSEHLVETKKKYAEKGTYTYKIEHSMPTDVLNLAMEIGLILDKSK